MSVASSVASMVSVGFRGDTATLEVALKRTLDDLRGHLNGVECKLREIAQLCENDPTFRDEVAMSDALDDELYTMAGLFAELRAMAYDLISAPEDASDKVWFKAHVAQRKIDEKARKKTDAAKIKADRAAEKAKLKVVNATLGDVAEDDETAESKE